MSSIVQHFITRRFAKCQFRWSTPYRWLPPNYFDKQNTKLEINPNTSKSFRRRWMYAKCLRQISRARTIGQPWHRARATSLAHSCRTCSTFFSLSERNIFFPARHKIFSSATLRSARIHLVQYQYRQQVGRVDLFFSSNRTAQNTIFPPNGLEIRVAIFFLFV